MMAALAGIFASAGRLLATLSSIASGSIAGDRYNFLDPYALV
jgi:hypothetical protein